MVHGYALSGKLFVIELLKYSASTRTVKYPPDSCAISHIYFNRIPKPQAATCFRSAHLKNSKSYAFEFE